jgi:Family of unknown function (DUF6129)
MISPECIDQVGRLVAAQGLDEGIVRALRQAFPDLHFTWCMDDEVHGAAPVRVLAGCNIYLVEGRGHCLGFTRDADAATGLVLAAREDDA